MDSRSLPPAATQSLQPIDWLGMGFAVPVGWEIVRHAVSVRKGHLAFVDRRHQRLTLYWTGCPSRPDARLLLESSRIADQEQHPNCRFGRMNEVGEWRGHRWSDEQGSVTRAQRFDETLGRWVEMVFSWPERREPELELAVLRSYHADSGVAAGGRVRAFGLDVRAPAGWALSRADVVPADVALSFAGIAGVASVRCTRMARQWHQGDLDSLARRQFGAVNASVLPARHAPHEARTAQSAERSFAWRWLLGGRRLRRDLLWLCPIADAVYQVQTQTQRRHDVAPDAFAVRCCSQQAQEMA
jgi:hypothetical protein